VKKKKSKKEKKRKERYLSTNIIADIISLLRIIIALRHGFGENPSKAKQSVLFFGLLGLCYE